MNLPDLQLWLFAQCPREDVVGELARDWNKVLCNCENPDFPAWLLEKRSDLKSGALISAAEAEYSREVEQLRTSGYCRTFDASILEPEVRERMETSAKFHRKYSDLTYSEYSNLLHKWLREDLDTLKVVYVDVCHWIKMRNYLCQSSDHNPAYKGVLHEMWRLRNEKKAIFPFSMPLLEEIMKQSDPASRMKTVVLMEELGGGVCIRHPIELCEVEIRHFIWRSVFGEGAPNVRDQIWTKIPNVIAELVPTSDAWSSETSRFIQKFSLDELWNTQLLELIEDLEYDNFPHRDFIAQAAAHNAARLEYTKEKLPITTIVEREMALLWCSYIGIERFTEIAREVYESHPTESLAAARRDHQSSPDKMLLSFIQVLAKMNATAFHSGKNIKPNDLWDSHHAALALPHSDYFFCDSPTEALLRQGPLKIADQYSAEICSTPEAMLSALAKM